MRCPSEDAEHRNRAKSVNFRHLGARAGGFLRPGGTKIIDSFALAKPSYQLIDPETEAVAQSAAS